MEYRKDTAELGNCWHFAEQLGGMDVGPNDPMSENFKKTPFASLIRESVQNSLDAVKNTSKPVTMRIKICRVDQRNFAHLFELRKYIEGCLSYYNQNRNAADVYKPMLEYIQECMDNRKLYYIKVSDFNTKGMHYKKDDTNCPYYAFVRSGGVTCKNDDTAGGSFGFGKAAYFYISALRTILVSTMTERGKVFFEGVASLCTNKTDNVKRVAVGFYDNNEGEPVNNQEKIPTRFQRKEPGTDINIMGIRINPATEEDDKNAIYKEMTEALLRNFWMAIYDKKLVVEFGDVEKEEGKEYCKVINSENLEEQMEFCGFDEVDSAKKVKNYNPRPYLEAVANAELDKNHVLFKDKLPLLGNVRFYAWKDKRGNSRIIQMRSPRMLVDGKRNYSSNEFYGVFFCDDPNGNRRLREMENAAHDEWSEKNWKVNGRTSQEAKDTMQELKEYMTYCVGKLFDSKDTEALKIRGLEENLYIPTEVEDDDVLESESYIGDSTNELKDDGNSMTGDVQQESQKKAEPIKALGKVMVGNSTSAAPQEKGGLLSGHSKKHKSKKKGGGVGSRNIQGRNAATEGGAEGTFMEEIPVRYRSFAQEENNEIVHNIVIHSDHDVYNGRIDLLVGGEQSDDEVDIVWASDGTVSGNSISELLISSTEKNVIKVKFADGMKHAVKLDAYEIK